jgi:hypothetical protein
MVNHTTYIVDYITRIVDQIARTLKMLKQDAKMPDAGLNLLSDNIIPFIWGLSTPLEIGHASGVTVAYNLI